MAGNIFGLTNNYPLEPKRNNLFTLWLDYIPGVGQKNDQTTDGLQMDLISCTRPTYTYNMVEMKRLNMSYKVAGTPTFTHTLSVVFRDTIQKNLGKIFYQWNKVIFNRANGTMGYASSYKTHGIIDMYDPRGMIIERWRIKGMWPSETNWADLTYDGNGDPLQVSVTFQYDVAWMDESSGTFNNTKKQNQTSSWVDAYAPNPTWGSVDSGVGKNIEINPEQTSADWLNPILRYDEKDND